MNYRILSKIIGTLDMISSTICLIAMCALGTIIITIIIQHAWSVNDSHGYASLFYYLVPFTAYVFVAYCCYINFIADGKLILATKKGQDPQKAIELSRNWVTISSFSLACRSIVLFWVVCDLLYYSVVYHYYSHNIYFDNCVFTLFSTRGFSLYCVNKFRRQLKDARNIANRNNITGESGITTETILNGRRNPAVPIVRISPRISVDTNNIDVNFARVPNSAVSNATDDLPSYVDAVNHNLPPPSYANIPPPSYDSLFNKDRIKISSNDIPDYF